MYHPAFSQYFTELVKEVCRETGYVCPYWLNDDIFNALSALDRKNNSNLAELYKNQCHEPDFIFKPATNHAPQKCEIRCRTLNYNNTENCRYSNLNASQEIEKRIEESQKAFAKETDAK